MGSGASSGTQAGNIWYSVGEFPSYGIWGRFPLGGKHLVRFNIGAPVGHPTRTVVLVGLDGAGNELPGISDTVTVTADGQYTTPMAIFDAAGRIVFFKIVEQGQAVPGTWFDFAGHAIDDFTFDVPDVPPTPDFALLLDLGATAGFPLTVSRGSTSFPGARVVVNRTGGSTGPLVFSTNGLPAGLAAQVTSKPAGDPTELTVRLAATASAPLVVNGSFDLVANPASPAVGPGPRSVTVPYTVVTDFDLAVSGIDVTQGIQPDQSLPPRPSVPGAGAAYTGLRLVAGKKTVARVFAVVAAPANAEIAGATIRLYGRTASGAALPGSPLVRTAGVIKNGFPNRVLVTTIKSGTPVATFVLPPAWTTAGRIELEAEVSAPPVLFGGASECCPTNNRFRLTDVVFRAPGFVRVHGIWLSGKYGLPLVGFPDELLAGVAQVLPLGDGDLVTEGEFRAVVDVTSVLHATTYGDLFPKGCGGLCNVPLDADKVYLSIVEDYETGDAFCHKMNSSPLKDPACPDVVMGFIDDPRVAGLSRGRALWGWSRAVANVRRPLTSVGHELVHGLGRHHASGGCGGDDKGQKADEWPDPFGGIQGIGYDVRDGRVLAAGTASPNDENTGAPSRTWFDLMSYCASLGGEFFVHSGPDPDGGGPGLGPARPWPLALWDAWISSVNWGRVLDDLIILNGFKVPGAARAARAARASERYGVAVRAFVDGGGVIVSRVAPVPVRLLPPPTSPATLELRDAAGGVLASVPMTIESSEGHGGEAVFVDADVPLAGAGPGALPPELAAAAIVTGGTTAAVVARSPNPPLVALRRLPRRLGRQRRFTVRWRASDADGDPRTAFVDFSADDGGTWRTIYRGPDTGRVKLPSRLLAPSPAARLRVRVSDGFDEALATSPSLVVLPPPPALRILSPTPGARVFAEDTLDLQAVAYDADGRDLRASVEWFDGRRLVATGSPASVGPLRPGRHRIRARVRGASGRRAKASVKIRVLREVAPPPPTTTTTTLPARCTADAECDDGNACTLDRCEGGACTSIEIGCALHACLEDAFCEPETGECVEVPRECGAGVCDLEAGGCAP